jgi:alpha-tubulin suppressor-like RCC1 family protein
VELPDTYLAVVARLSVSAAAWGSSSGSNITAVTAGYLHTCALTSAGRVECWARFRPAIFTRPPIPTSRSGLGPRRNRNSDRCRRSRCVRGHAGRARQVLGQQPPGSARERIEDRQQDPVAVSTLSRGVTALASGSTTDYLPSHSCAITRGGAVRCWGPNSDGQLGNGSTKDSARPVAVSGLTGIVAVTVGGAHTCAITKDRRVKCWGADENEQLGNGSLKNSPTPVDLGIS